MNELTEKNMYNRYTYIYIYVYTCKGVIFKLEKIK